MLPKTTLQLVQFLVCKDSIPDGFFNCCVKLLLVIWFKITQIFLEQVFKACNNQCDC